MIRLIVLVLCLLFTSSFSFATEKPDITVGEKLFQATTLGTNGKGCVTCHSAGKGLQEVSFYDDITLKEMINFCIRDALKGEMIGLDSIEMNSLLIYLKNFKTRGD